MLFPPSTLFDRRIPKTKFYDHLPITSQLKRVFIDTINKITWLHKISPDTTTLAPGQAVMEIEVLTIHLNQPTLDQKILELIDRAIPYHVLFLLSCADKMQAWIAYKEVNASTICKPGRYYHTAWLQPEALPLRLDGLTMDAVYENLIRQVAGDALTGGPAATPQGIKEALRTDAQRRKLQREITALEGKLQREKQFNRQMELYTTLQQLRAALHNITG